MKKGFVGNLPIVRRKTHPEPVPRDMREREWMQFVALPAAAAAAASTADNAEGDLSFPKVEGGGRGEEEDAQVRITHTISPDRIFAHERATRRGELRPGDRYAARLNPGYVGTTWWCWGDDGDGDGDGDGNDDDEEKKKKKKRRRKFSEWRKGNWSRMESRRGGEAAAAPRGRRGVGGRGGAGKIVDGG